MGDGVTWTPEQGCYTGPYSVVGKTVKGGWSEGDLHGSAGQSDDACSLFVLSRELYGCIVCTAYGCILDHVLFVHARPPYPG